MTFQPLIPTVLTPVVVPVLPDPAAAILAVAEALQPDLAQGFQIDALRLRLEMERAFGGSDATGAWDWKLAYEAGEVALVLFLRKFGRALLARAGSLDALMPILAKVSGLLPTHTRRSEEMERFQQFSTPLPMGLTALAAAKITHADLVLEPSAGTGLLAILAEIAGGALALNELAETRRADKLQVGIVGMRVDPRTISADKLNEFVASLGLPVLGTLRDTQNYIHLAARGLTLFDVAPGRVEKDLQQWQAICRWLDA